MPTQAELGWGTLAVLRDLFNEARSVRGDTPSAVDVAYAPGNPTISQDCLATQFVYSFVI